MKYCGGVHVARSQAPSRAESYDFAPEAFAPRVPGLPADYGQTGIPFTDLGNFDHTARADYRVIARWPDGDGLLDESVEEQPPSLGAPSVEAEGEFVEVVVEMLVLNAALVRNQSSISWNVRG